MLTQSAPRIRHFDGLSPHGFHRVCYFEWGDPSNAQVVIGVHGLSRNGRDFDVLGEALAPTHRVLAVDLPGRGISQWLADPNDYTFPTYLGTLTALIARSGAERVSWVGTSMGALLGMIMAAQPNTPVARLVVNDAGPQIEPAALARIRDYLGLDPTFASFAEADAYIRRSRRRLARLTDAQWDHLTGPASRSVRRAAWASPTIRHCRCRFAIPPRLPTCGRYGTPFVVRCWCCEAPIPTCSRRLPQARWRRAAPSRRSSKFPASAMRPCSFHPTSTVRSSIFCAVEA
jgi:pimeloyl-ACP methyl ester carboxylesterase